MNHCTYHDKVAHPIRARGQGNPFAPKRRAMHFGGDKPAHGSERDAIGEHEEEDGAYADPRLGRVGSPVVRVSSYRSVGDSAESVIKVRRPGRKTGRTDHSSDNDMRQGHPDRPCEQPRLPAEPLDTSQGEHDRDELDDVHVARHCQSAFIVQSERFEERRAVRSSPM